MSNVAAVSDDSDSIYHYTNGIAVTQRIILNIFNRHIDKGPLAITDVKTTRAGLGRIIIELDKAGHAVMSGSFNGNIADVVISALDEKWRRVFEEAVRTE